MNIDAAIFEIMKLGLFSFLLWILVFWLIPDYRIDAVRQRLFVVRDDLFDRAAAGIIAFNHPAYRMLREHINRCIRTAHRVNVFMVIALIFLPCYRRNAREMNFSKTIENSSADLSNEAKKCINEAYREVQNIMLSYVLFGLDRVLLHFHYTLTRTSKNEFPRRERQAIRIIEGEVCSLDIVERQAKREESNLASGMGY